jgi:hypothetical protein
MTTSTRDLHPISQRKGNAKLRDHWDSFVQYNLTLETTKMIAKNTINASKKEFHKLGSGGYKVVMPK